MGKLLQAFFPETEDNQAMTTMAALAGCDYSASQSLERAQTYIVQSDGDVLLFQLL